MDYTTIITIISLVFAGAALCYWPMSLKIRAVKKELGLALQESKVHKEEAKTQVSSAQRIIDVEREISNLKDLTPIDRLNRLLNLYGNKKESPSREA